MFVFCMSVRVKSVTHWAAERSGHARQIKEEKGRQEVKRVLKVQTQQSGRRTKMFGLKSLKARLPRFSRHSCPVDLNLIFLGGQLPNRSHIH